MKKSVIKRRKRTSNSVSRSNERSNGNTGSSNGRTKQHGLPNSTLESHTYDFSRLFTFKHHGPLAESNRLLNRLEPYQDGMISKLPREPFNSLIPGEKRSLSFSAGGVGGKHRRVSDSQVDPRPWSTSPLPERIQPSPVFSSYSLPSPTHVSSIRDSLSMSPRRLSEERNIFMPPVINSESAIRHLPSLPPINLTRKNSLIKQGDLDLPPISEFGPSVLSSTYLNTSNNHSGSSHLNIQREISPLKSILEHSSAHINDSIAKSFPRNPTKLTAYHLHTGLSNQGVGIFSDPVLHSLTSKSMRNGESKIESTSMLAPIQNLF
ncbi:GATA type transcriptional activator of nitrogen-regulated proteins, variant 2 [Basidiobolus ranarum]